MKKMRSGFTFIEVSLFLAITGLIFVGIAVGTQNSIFWQRYNDSVQSFAEFLRSEYSRVANVQINDNNANDDKAIYGRVVIFSDDGSITSYSVYGEVDADTNGSIMTMLEKLGVDIDDANGITEIFRPRWGSEIQTTNGWSGSGYFVYTGAILIVRHPSAGTIYTFAYDGNDINAEKFKDKIKEKVGEAYVFKQKDVDFCVNPNGKDKSNLRRDIRIIKDARNASGVEIVPDGEILNDDGENVGNRCAD